MPLPLVSRRAPVALLASLWATLLLNPLPALAAYPEKPITIVVPYPPGGAADVLGRIVARHLQLQLQFALVGAQ